MLPHTISVGNPKFISSNEKEVRLSTTCFIGCKKLGLSVIIFYAQFQLDANNKICCMRSLSLLQFLDYYLSREQQQLSAALANSLVLR